jgi:bifunctional DNase/RNase
MEILGLSTSPSNGEAYALVLSEAEGNRRLPIIIGHYEAQAIALELEHIRPPRPMTHDLLRDIIQNFSGYVKKIVVNDLREGTFFAQVVIEADGVTLNIDSRPSDAVALGIRFNAPIFVAASVLEEAGIEAEQEQEKSATAMQEVKEEKSSTATKNLSPQEKLTKLEEQLDSAIKAENYEQAARLRDEIEKLKN